MAHVTRTLEHGERERKVLVHIAVRAIQLGQVKTVAATHRVPADRLPERLGGRRVVTLVHEGKREVGVETVERLAHVAELARVLLDASIAQSLEDGGEAEPLDLVGSGAVSVYVLLGIRRKAFEKLDGEICLAAGDESLGGVELVGHVRALVHLSSFRVARPGRAPRASVKSIWPFSGLHPATVTATLWPRPQVLPVDSPVRHIVPSSWANHSSPSALVGRSPSAHVSSRRTNSP